MKGEQDVDTRFFSMKQLWQSLGIMAVVVAVFLAIITHHVYTKAKDTAAAGQTSTSSLGASADSAATIAAAPSSTTVPNANAFVGLHLSGQAAIVVDLSNGTTLYSQNADTPLPLASLTKLLTMYAASTALSPASPVVITNTALAQDGDYGLVLGETFAYKDISRFALVGSSNDAAEAIAEAAAQNVSETPQQLLANAISSAGLTQTTATNGTGLDIDATEAGAYGSARDVAKLAEDVLQKSPDLAHATTLSSASARSLEGTLHTIPNTNPDAAKLPGMLLSKTGYTDLAGGNLAVIFDAGINHPIAVVVLGSTREARFTDVETLMKATLEQFVAKQ